MKRVSILILSIFFLACMLGNASALEFNYSTTWTGNVDSYGTDPEIWFELGLPTLDNSGWVYDSDDVTKFDITLTYQTTYSDSIEIWPPCREIIEWTIAKPSPVPFGLVVK